MSRILMLIMATVGVVVAVAALVLLFQPVGSSFAGVVHLDGEPITKGRLILTPDHEKGNQGKRILCDIKNGGFCFLADETVTPGPNVAIVTVHPLPSGDGTVTLRQLAQMPFYMVDIEVPSDKSNDFVITVHRDKNKNKQTGRYGHQQQDQVELATDHASGEDSAESR